MVKIHSHVKIVKILFDQKFFAFILRLNIIMQFNVFYHPIFLKL